MNISLGLQDNFPFLINDKIQYQKLSSSGGRLDIHYQPENSLFSPSISFGLTTIDLNPSSIQFNNALFIRFTNWNLMLNGHYTALNLSKGQFTIYAGIGLSCLYESSVGIVNDNALMLSFDSTSPKLKLLPTIHIGCEYMRRISRNHPLFLGIGINISYTDIFNDKNSNYTLNVEDSQYNYYTLHAHLSGQLISPGFYLMAHYIFIR